MSEISVRSKTDTATVVLALVGGPLIMVGGILFFTWNYSWSGMSSMMHGDMMQGGMMMGNMMHGMWMMDDRLWFNVGNILLLSSVGAGAIVTVAGLMMHSRPEDYHKWGIVVLVFSVFGFLGMGGFIIGSMLGILAGILALFRR